MKTFNVQRFTQVAFGLSVYVILVGGVYAVGQFVEDAHLLIASSF